MARSDSAPRRLWLGQPEFSRNQVSLVFGVDDLRFSTSYWYTDVDFPELERRFGSDVIRSIVFHMAAFEANKLGSLRPQVFDAGPFKDLVTPAFVRLWSTIFRRVWAQWRYENELPDYFGPDIDATASHGVPPVAHDVGETEVLAFCGGGKDSLVSLRLLEQLEIPYSSFSYSHSIYGQAAPQHQLINSLLDFLTPRVRHRQWVYDDFLDSPVLSLRPEFGVETITAAETPSSIFAALPLALANGYSFIALGHERSADAGNLRWETTGEEVNHQWGKSLEAELLLQDYVTSHLVSTVTYASVLKPVYDVVIFNELNRHLDAVGATHSCNVQKPWCERCAKCAYVFLNYAAYLPEDVLGTIFRTNLFETPENQLWFRQMLGLADHTPFECIGQVDETRLAFEICRRKGLHGAAVDMYASEAPPIDIQGVLETFTEVAPEHQALPDRYREPVVQELVAAGRRARVRLERLFESPTTA